jgi:AcrR family transcriptional regulator
MPKISANTVAEHHSKQRQQILKAAKQLFKTNGVEGVSFEDIAKKANLARPSIYVYFKSKSDLISALLEESYPVLFSEIEAAMASKSKPREKIEAFFQANLRIVESGHHDFVFSLLHSELEAKVISQIDEYHKKVFSLLITPLTEMGIKDSSENLMLVSGVLHSSVQAIIMNKQPSSKMAKRAAQFALGGLKALI